jgi:HSP20 family protein
MSNITPKNNTLSPWAGFRDLENQLERIFHGTASPGSAQSWVPPVDIHETEDAYVMEADLPGMSKDDFDLQIMEDRIVLRGTRKRLERENVKGYWRFERAEGAFERSFRVQGGVDAEKVEARFENGVLTVTLPKPEESKPRQIEIKVN